jgi:diguanylate cyclase (GGDEF)-like protein
MPLADRMGETAAPRGERRGRVGATDDLGDRRRASGACPCPTPADSGDLCPQIETAVHPAYALDPDGRVHRVNDLFAALLGATVHELTGAHFSRLVYEDDLSRARWRFNERRTGARASVDVPIRLRRFTEDDVENDRPVPVLLSAAGQYGESLAAGAASPFLGTVGMVQASASAAAPAAERHGIASRARFMAAFAAAISRSKASDRCLAVVVLNIDRFKRVNDTFGHLGGDRLLEETAARLRRAIGDDEPLTRLGGDEFAALLCAPRSASEAKLVADLMLQSLHQPVLLNDAPYMARASVGLALSPDHGADERALLRASDRAMREAKRRGGNQVRVYSAAMERNRSADADLEHDLRAALSREELEVLYQPIHDLDAGRVDSLEALVRWRHPTLGLLEPATFMHIAEESGLVRALDHRVLDLACAQLRAWRASGCGDLRLSVNLSARDFEHDDCVASVADTLARHDVPPDALEVEVTEHSLLASGDAAARAADLRRHGVRLAIDDFGTKYSSLAYLQRLPVSTIKVDRAFVRDVGRSSAGDSIVQALIGIAQAMDLRLVAEGVEEIEQVRYLRGLGCHLMQGYLFSRPLSAQVMEQSLARAMRA